MAFFEENRKNLTYIGKPDNFFFQRMVDVVFQSGIRGEIWEWFEGKIRKEFANYDVKKVAEFSDTQVRPYFLTKHGEYVAGVVDGAFSMVCLFIIAIWIASEAMPNEDRSRLKNYQSEL